MSIINFIHSIFKFQVKKDERSDSEDWDDEQDTTDVDTDKNK